jgi:hypothetical protein
MSMPPIDKWSSIQQIYMEVFELGCPQLNRKKSNKKKTAIACPPKTKKRLKRKCPLKRNCCCRKIVVRRQIVRVNIPQGAVGTAGTVGAAGAVGTAGTVGTAGSVGSVGTAGTVGAVGAAGTVGVAGAVGATGATGPAGGVLGFADFFALMPPDNAATVAPATDVSFPQNGPTSGAAITRTGPSTFNLSAIGTYQVLFQVSVTEPGQLILTLNGADLAYTVVGRATGTSQIVGMALVQTTVINSILTVRNPAGNATALTITPLGGGTRPVSAHLVITRIA